VDGLQVYTERHLARLDRLVRSTYLLDYTLATMKASVCVCVCVCVCGRLRFESVCWEASQAFSSLLSMLTSFPRPPIPPMRQVLAPIDDEADAERAGGAAAEEVEEEEEEEEEEVGGASASAAAAALLG
jgi:hypothetical protein